MSLSLAWLQWFSLPHLYLSNIFSQAKMAVVGGGRWEWREGCAERRWQLIVGEILAPRGVVWAWVTVWARAGRWAKGSSFCSLEGQALLPHPSVTWSLDHIALSGLRPLQGYHHFDNQRENQGPGQGRAYGVSWLRQSSCCWLPSSLKGQLATMPTAKESSAGARTWETPSEQETNWAVNDLFPVPMSTACPAPPQLFP